MRKRIPIVLLMILAAASVQAQQEERPVPMSYEIKWRNVNDILQLIEGFRGYVDRISGSPAFNLITVTATPRGHAVIAELIRKYDVPAKTIEFQFYLIKASSAGEGIKNGLPENIRKVINGVAALTRYKSFELLDAPVLRATEGQPAGLSGKGVYFYHLGSERFAIVTTDQKKRQIRVDEFFINFSILVGNNEKGPLFKEVGVHTSFNIADGETVVIGASHIKEDPKETGTAIVTVVTARILD